MKAISFKKVAKVFAVAVLMGAIVPSAAHATTTLKQVQISNGSQIDLLFDGKVQKSQIRTEFSNDVIQLNIQDVSVYPAKISSVNGGSLTKIFAYQYAPKLVRCRLTVKGKAEDYKDKLDIKVNGRILTVRMQGDRQVAPGTSGDSSPAAKANVKIESHAVTETPSAASAPDEEERALLSRVIAASASLAAGEGKQAPAQAAAGAAEKAPVDKKDSLTLSSAAPAAAQTADSGASTENQPIHLTGETSGRLGGAKPLPSPLKIFGKMGIVLGLFGLLAFALKRYASGRADSRLSSPSALQAAADKGGWLGTLGRIAKKGLSREGKMIEVLSTHYLGPKKSIAVVRVAGRVLVLGVSNESINLITQLSGEDAAEQLGELDLSDLVAPRASAPAPSFAQPRQTARPAAPQSQHSYQSAQGGAGAMGAGNAIFSDLLNAERGKPAFANPSGAAAYGATPKAAQGNPNVRAQIRNRLEGLKQL